MAAKYYIYRNLNKGGFSVKHKGLVVARMDRFVANDVEFRVSEASRKRAMREGQRNVHAYMVCDKMPFFLNTDDQTADMMVERAGMKPIYYHPLETETFVLAGTSKPVTEADHILATNEKVYVTA